MSAISPQEPVVMAVPRSAPGVAMPIPQPAEVMAPDSAHGKSGHHPLSLIAMGIWVAYISVMVWLLQHSARIATRSVHQPWYYDWLPSVLLTGFAQGHLAVTAMYLARLGLSALQSERTIPRTWAELFWLADRRWQSPMGVGATLMDRHKIKAKLSSTFLLFAMTCLIALPTPIIVSRAWPVFTVWVQEDTTLTTDTFSPLMMSSIEFSSQLSTGEGAWATGMSVEDIYSSSTFTPSALPWDETSDYFFAGDVDGEDVVMPGVRVQGSCTELPNAPATPPDFDSFLSWCLTEMPGRQSDGGLDFEDRGNVAQWWWCMDYAPNNTVWMNASPYSNASALVYFNSTNGQTAVEGYIQCNTTFATGDAVLNGRQLTYDNFYEIPFYDTSEEGSDGVGTTLLHPLYAALYDISQAFTAANTSDQRSITLMKALGYTASYNNNTGVIDYAQPSLSTVATQIWRGTAHMGAAIAILSRASNQTYPSIIYQSVSGRVSNIPFIGGGAFLLLAWLIMVVVCTIRMYRPTFGSSLDNYVAARMLAHRRDLVDDHAWDMTQNKRLTGAFSPIDHTESGSKHSMVESPTGLTTFVPAQAYQV